MSRLQRLCNRAVRVTCRLRKCDHVSAAHHKLGWLPFELLVQYRTLVLMYRHYNHDNCVQQDPPLLLGPNHGYDTRQSSHFCNFSDIQLLLDKLDLKQQCSGIVFLAHFLIMIFHELCLIIYLICTVYKYIIYILLLNVYVYLHFVYVWCMYI